MTVCRRRQPFSVYRHHPPGLGAYLFSRSRQKREVPNAQHTEFSDALTSAMTASQVYEEEMGQQDSDDPHPAAGNRD